MMKAKVLPKFELTEQEKRSSLGVKMRKQFENELDALRKKNDAPLSDTETNLLRGEIRNCKKNLALFEPGIKSPD